MLVEKNNKIIVTQNPTGNILYILLSFGMTSIAIILLKFGYILEMDLLMKFLTIIVLLFFGFATCFFIFRTIINKDLIVVDENGIMDNTSAVSLGFIEWDDIVDIKVSYLDEAGFISIILSDEEKYLNRVSPLKKPAILANIGLGFGPANISLNSSGVSLDEFYEKLIEYKNKLNK